MAVVVCQRPGSLFLLLLLLLLLLHNVQCTSWTPSSRVCCAPGLPESANEVATGSLRYIVIISISWWRLSETRRCLALAAEDRKSEVRSQPLRTQRSRQTCESTSYILFRCSHMRCANCSALSCPAQMQQAAVDSSVDRTSPRLANRARPQAERCLCITKH